MTVLFAATVIFVLYSTSESFANIARHAGSRTGHYPLGLMLSNQVYSINRLGGFLIAPLLGFYVDRGGGEHSLKMFALLGCVSAAFLLTITLKVWPFLLRICVNVVSGIERHGFSFRIFFTLLERIPGINYRFSNRKKDVWVLFGQSVATSLAVPAAFILNLLAIRHPQYQATLVQSATAISGIGNLILNFYIIPRVALAETRGSADAMYYSIMLGKILGIGVLSSCVIVLI